MSTIAELLVQQAAQQRQLAAQCAARLGDQVDLAALTRARAELLAQLADLDERIETARAYAVAVETAEWLEGQARTLAPPDAAEAIAATGLPVQPAPPQPPAEQTPDGGSDYELPFNVVDAPPETVAAITGGTPIISDPDALAAGDPIVTAVDPVPAPGDGQPRHARPKARGTGPLRLLRRHPDDPTTTRPDEQAPATGANEEAD